MAAELLAGTPGRGEKSPAEARRHIRVEVQLAVGFSIADGTARTLTRAVTRDVSHGGACLAVTGCSAQLLERLGDLPLLDILIEIPRAAADAGGETATLTFHGRVEWVRFPAPPGGATLVGLEFCNLDAAAETAIIDLIAHLLLVSGEPLPASHGV
jgi:c-di-GMP-binding flagellar brake protein YcgR